MAKNSVEGEIDRADTETTDSNRPQNEFDLDSRVEAAVCLDTVMAVVDSWNIVKMIPNFSEVAGEILFRKIFELAPGAWKLFSFGKNYETASDELFNSKAFKRHSAGVVKMLDLAIDLLGPDLEIVSESLCDLGSRHVNYGVMPEHYPIVGEALLSTLEVALAERFTPEIRGHWVKIFTFVTTKMMQGASRQLQNTLRAYECATVETASSV